MKPVFFESNPVFFVLEFNCQEEKMSEQTRIKLPFSIHKSIFFTLIELLVV